VLSLGAGHGAPRSRAHDSVDATYPAPTPVERPLELAHLNAAETHPVHTRAVDARRVRRRGSARGVRRRPTRRSGRWSGCSRAAPESLCGSARAARRVRRSRGRFRSARAGQAIPRELRRRGCQRIGFGSCSGATARSRVGGEGRARGCAEGGVARRTLPLFSTAGSRQESDGDQDVASHVVRVGNCSRRGPRRMRWRATHDPRPLACARR
jgi:hypothetical protein